MTRLHGWVHDLLLGARLAVSGRGGPARLALISVGVGMGVAVLLLTGSLGHADDARNAREDARMPRSVAPGESEGQQAPLLVRYDGTEFRGERVQGSLLDPMAPEPPLPPGIDRVPAHGEVYLSPALADLLASEDGELLRPRFPWTVAGTIGQEGLVDPHELRYYAGADLSAQADVAGDTLPVVGFGDELPRSGLTPVETILRLGAAMMLLLPVFILVGAATRIAAASRERRLAALRLVGADVGQTARIASGEALTGSLVGLLIGGAVFLAATPLAEHVKLFGYSAFREDLRPPPIVVALIVLGVPALAVLAGLVALRHTVVHPLGTSRRAAPPQRRLWWRLVPMAGGIAMLVPLAGAGTAAPDTRVEIAVLAGLLLLGISVPLLLPWLLQRVSRRLAGGPPSWQLAVRRIQLDSSTPARAAAGIAAVLTAAVAVQTLLNTALAEDDRPDAGDRDAVAVYADDATPDELAELDLAGIAGVRQVHWYQQAYADTATLRSVDIRIGDCAALALFAELGDCDDGDLFVRDQPGPAPGDDLVFSRWFPQDEQPTEIGRWTVPAGAQRVVVDEGGPGQSIQPVSSVPVVLATPSAADAIPPGVLQSRAGVLVDPSDRDVVEHLRNALVVIGDASVNEPAQTSGESYIAQLRSAVLAGSVIVLVLAAASMLIVSIEQVRERRQQLAALAAGGVGNATLGRSVLWQALLPFTVAAVAAVAVGITLATLFLRVIDIPMAVDWVGISVLVVACLAAVLLVTVLTLPSLRAATRPESLRTE